MGVWWRVGNTKLSKHKKHQNILSSLACRLLFMYIYGNHSDVFWRSSTVAKVEERRGGGERERGREGGRESSSL